jgi:hypothetical protein
MTAREGSIGALIAEVGHPHPFAIPGSAAILWVYPACGKEAFGDHRTAFLRCAEQPHEFDRELFIVRPLDPAPWVKTNFHIGYDPVPLN